MTVQEILEDVYDEATGKIRLKVGTGTPTEDTSIHAILNAVHDQTNHALLSN
jgi:hypothetical protein